VKRFFLFIIVIAFCFSLPAFLKKWTCGFKVKKIQISTLAREEWDVKSDITHDELSHILSQPFIYLDRGMQSYVFVSLDGEYVIKFFRITSEEKIGRLFNASVLAYTKAKEETGLVFLHLNETKNQFPKLRIRGPLGQRFKIPLDRYRFAIQKKAKKFRASLLSAYQSSDAQEMKQRIDSFVGLLRSRIEKGIRNGDPSLSRNFAFLGNQAVEIDFGNYAEGVVSKEMEMMRYTQGLYFFLVDNAPEWADYLKTCLKDYELKELQKQQDSKLQGK